MRLRRLDWLSFIYISHARLQAEKLHVVDIGVLKDDQCDKDWHCCVPKDEKSSEIKKTTVLYRPSRKGMQQTEIRFAEGRPQERTNKRHFFVDRVWMARLRVMVSFLHVWPHRKMVRRRKRWMMERKKEAIALDRHTLQVRTGVGVAHGNRTVHDDVYTKARQEILFCSQSVSEWQDSHNCFPSPKNRHILLAIVATVWFAIANCGSFDFRWIYNHVNRSSSTTDWEILYYFSPLFEVPSVCWICWDISYPEEGFTRTTHHGSLLDNIVDNGLHFGRFCHYVGCVFPPIDADGSG